MAGIKTSKAFFSCTHFKAKCVYVVILLTVCVNQYICTFKSIRMAEHQSEEANGSKSF